MSPASHTSLANGSDDGRAEHDGASKRWIWILIGASIFGLVRFWKLSEWSLWIDEALTWTDIHIGLEGGENRNPLGYHAIAATVKLLGGVPDEFALRFLPALAGWLAIPLTFFAFRRWCGAFVAASAALVLAASSWHIYWSQNARFYTFAQATSLAGAALVLAALRSGSSVRAVLGLALVGTAALFHPSAAMLVPALLAAPWILAIARRPLDGPWRRPAVWMAIAAGVGLLAASGWLYSAWRTYLIRKSQDGSVEGAFASLAHYVRTTGFYVTPVLGAGAVMGAWFALRARDARGTFVVVVTILVLAAALVPAALARVSAQYVFFVLPWIALAACLPLAELARARRGFAAAYLALLWLPALTSTALYFTVRKGERPQWRAAYDLVWSARGEGDLVLGMETPVGEYYCAPDSVDLRHTRNVAWLDWFNARAGRAWAPYPRRTWFVVNPELMLDMDPVAAADLKRMLAEECRLVASYPLYVESRDLSVWVYVRR